MKMRSLLLIALGGLMALLLDPVMGRSRRARIAQQAPATLRRSRRSVQRLARRGGSVIYGTAMKATHRREAPGPQPNDPTLEAKVETELFRDPGIPKGDILVNAQRGIIQLRGQVPTQELIDTIVRRTRKVDGVLGVENLLHVPGTTAPRHL